MKSDPTRGAWGVRAGSERCPGLNAIQALPRLSPAPAPRPWWPPHAHLLEHLVDVHRVGFFAPAAPSGLLVPRTPASPAPRLLQLSVLSAHPPGLPGGLLPRLGRIFKRSAARPPGGARGQHLGAGVGPGPTQFRTCSALILKEPNCSFLSTAPRVLSLNKPPPAPFPTLLSPKILITHV